MSLKDCCLKCHLRTPKEVGAAASNNYGYKILYVSVSAFLSVFPSTLQCSLKTDD